MQSATANSDVYRLSLDRAKCFIATASFPLRALRFEHSRPLDADNVNRLKRVFDAGFYPERAEHRIPALVTKTDLLQEPWFSPGEEKYQPPNGYTINCLHGLHRVKAAEELYGPNSTWVVDLYDTELTGKADLDPNTERSFIERYENEKPPDGGELFYNIRKYRGQSNGYQVNRASRKWWQAQCSKTQLQAISRLKRHDDLMLQLDRLSPLKALHPAVKLGSIGRLIALSCEEWIYNLLEQLGVFWWDVFDKDEQAMNKFSAESLVQLVGLAPGANETQRKSIQRDIIAQRIFGEFADDEGNKKGLAYFSRIVANTTKSIIPSLDVVFKNLVYFERAALNIKQLLPPLRRGQSIRETLYRHFRNVPENESFLEAADRSNMATLRDTEHRWIQTDASTLQLFECNQDRFDLFVRQIWAAALRIVDSKPPSKKPRTPGSETDIGNPYALQQLAMLAYKLGFESRQSKALRTGNTDLTMAAHVLKMSLLPGYSYMPDEFDPVSENLAREMHRAREDARKLKKVYEKPQGRGGGKPFGIPSKEDFERDWPNMFLHKLHGAEHEEEFGASVSSFFVARSLYFSILGGDGIRLGQPLQTYTVTLDAQSVSETYVAAGLPRDNTALETELRRENTELTSRIGEIQNQYEKATEELQSAVDNTALVAELRRKITELTSRIVEIQNQYEEATRELQSAAERTASASGLARDNTALEAKLRQEIIELTSRIVGIRNQHEEATRELQSEAERTASASEKKAIELEKLLNTEKNRVRLLEGQFNAMKQDNSNKQRVADELTEELANKNADWVTYQQSMETALSIQAAELDTARQQLRMHLEGQGVRIVTTSGGRVLRDTKWATRRDRAEELKPMYSLHCHRNGKWFEATSEDCFRLAEDTGVIVAKHIQESEMNLEELDFYGGGVPLRSEGEEASAVDRLLQDWENGLQDREMGLERITIHTKRAMKVEASEEEVREFAQGVYSKDQGCFYCPAEINGKHLWIRVTPDEICEAAKTNDCHGVLLMSKQEEFPPPDVFSIPKRKREHYQGDSEEEPPHAKIWVSNKSLRKQQERDKRWRDRSKRRQERDKRREDRIKSQHESGESSKNRRKSRLSQRLRHRSKSPHERIESSRNRRKSRHNQSSGHRSKSPHERNKSSSESL
ncbi:hypothetical protein LEL_10564 [Akanthomyces lecanii RCEF 1005]|uniref:Uncharacterized protein n=1 Tax=Akanthomyces lecanii RCEF 1005 TaxID=1081108 RepID=A0A167XLD4_CORDF|nr:hypothetical protein LEL_10564 [Akanthomyces lecanii RCEF 1005]